MAKYERPSEDADYKPLYYGLFNGITTVIKTADNYEQAIAALKQLQSDAEDAYIEQGVHSHL